MSAIALTPEADGRVQIKPIGYVTDFRAYLTACNGAQFDNARKCQIATIDRTLTIVGALQAAGFTTEIDPAVAAKLSDHLESKHASVTQASGRVEAVEAILASKGLNLYAYQGRGVTWLAARSAALLADEMGLGKTIQALTALPPGAPVVVICPAVAKGVWERETAKWRPDYRVTVISGRGKFRWPEAGEMVILNYDILPAAPPKAKHDPWAEVTGKVAPKPKPTVPDAPEGCVIIADEAHALKSSKSKRTHAFRQLSTLVLSVGGKVWLLTATPLLNRPQELWSILAAADLQREAFGSWKRFLYLFSGTPGKWGGFEWGTPRPEAPEAIARVSLRRIRTEVLPDLPTKTWKDVPCAIDAKTSKHCDMIMDVFPALHDDSFANFIMSGGTSSGGKIAFEDISRVRAELATAKIPAMLATVEEYEEAGEPLIVFSYHRAPIDALASREGWRTITGDVPPAERSRIEADFQAGKLKGIAATIQAGGVAITLTRAHHALFVDLAWTPALNAQAEDRLCRIGQANGVLITRLVGDHPLDRRVTALLSVKQGLIDSTVEASAKVAKPEAAPLPTVDLTPVAPLADSYESEERAAIQAEGTAENAPAAPVAAPKPTFAAGRRAARNETEVWAAKGLTTLAASDADHAQERNGVGFSKWDNEIGHSLARQVDAGFSEKQWALVVKIALRYRRQLGGV